MGTEMSAGCLYFDLEVISRGPHGELRRAAEADQINASPKHDDPTAPLGVAALTRMLDDFIQERVTAGAALPTVGAPPRDAVGQSVRVGRPIAAGTVEGRVPPTVGPAAPPKKADSDEKTPPLCASILRSLLRETSRDDGCSGNEAPAMAARARASFETPMFGTLVQSALSLRPSARSMVLNGPDTLPVANIADLSRPIMANRSQHSAALQSADVRSSPRDGSPKPSSGVFRTPDAQPAVVTSLATVPPRVLGTTIYFGRAPRAGSALRRPSESVATIVDLPLAARRPEIVCLPTARKVDRPRTASLHCLQDHGGRAAGPGWLAAVACLALAAEWGIVGRPTTANHAAIPSATAIAVARPPGAAPLMPALPIVKPHEPAPLPAAAAQDTAPASTPETTKALPPKTPRRPRRSADVG